MALLAAVVALATLTGLAVGLAYTSAVDQHLTRNALAALQADALARSGVAVATALLAERGDAADGPDAAWARGSGRQPLGAGWVSVAVEDEARRLDLGIAALADAVPRLLVGLGLDPALADALADWIDADDVPRPGGAERAHYLGLTPPYVPANRPLATVGELRLVRGFDARTVARLRPFVTVAGEPAVNPNTAAREVLAALPALGPADVERLVAARALGPIGEAALDGLVSGAARRVLTTRAQHYTVHVESGVGEVRRAVEALVAAPAGVEPRVEAWRPVAVAVDEAG